MLLHCGRDVSILPPVSGIPAGLNSGLTRNGSDPAVGSALTKGRRIALEHCRSTMLRAAPPRDSHGVAMRDDDGHDACAADHAWMVDACTRLAELTGTRPLQRRFMRLR